MARTFFDEQRRHRRRTAALVAVELLLLWLLGNVVVLPAHLARRCDASGECRTVIDLDGSTLLAVALFTVAFLAVAVAVAGRRAADGDGLPALPGVDDRRLREAVAQMSIAAGLPEPRTLVVRSAAWNAYAVAGRHGGTIVCTSGLLAALDQRELTGVVAHEMAHLRNRDSTVVWTATFGVGLVVVLAALAAMFGDREPEPPRLPTHLRDISRAERAERRARSGWRRIATAASVALWLVAVPAAALVRAAISRRRELLADASAVQLTRDPTGLRSALERIAAGPTDRAAGGRARPGAAGPPGGLVTAALWIHVPAGSGGRWARWFDSHPPIEQRIAWLRSLERSGELWSPLPGAA